MRGLVSFVVTCGVVGAGTCDLLVLQDLSFGYDGWKYQLAEGLAGLQSLNANKTRLRVGLASFTDKPTAYLGYRAGFGGWTEIPNDYCYKFHLPLTPNLASVKKRMIALEGSGGADFQEAQFEALVRAVNEPQFGTCQRTEAQAGGDKLQKPVAERHARLLLLITDEAPHIQGDLQASLDHWRLSYGDEQFCFSGLIAEQFVAQCLEAGKLAPAIDEGVASATELTRWNELQIILGARLQPVALPHPVAGVLGNEGCLDFEYPAWHQVRDLIEANDVLPIFLITTQQGLPPWEWFAEQFAPTAPVHLVHARSNVTQLILDALRFYHVCTP
eukprot:Gregarina_sp_Pseudo_9__1608@NODE_2083_length_1159_cov_49_170536_g1924_i0_p2_GENE_NODE_2083_length_1159_cov_49_170536_g1924_i0NODE_2083_length_1159_cov_49_170536_g1924_i0_p2_ORF_typecomplete_len330_score99_74Integrin_beta/PF00362_18/1_1e13Integrin_beta/PF00362_18/4_4e05_NODE_2083_length_1159_cov_49_170536_g1924_i01061095